jgi:hypothetical protein
MTPYTFTTAVTGAITTATAAAETRATGTINSAQPLSVGAFEAGGGGAHADFWQIQLAGGEQVAVDVTATSTHEYTFQLFAPGTVDSTFGQQPAADTAKTNGASPDQITLQAPYSGTFILAVCENVDNCPAAFDGEGDDPMTPYTFTTTVVSPPGPPPNPPPVPRPSAPASVTLTRQSATVTPAGRLAIKLTCGGAPCTGTIKLTMSVTKTTGKGKKKKTRTTKVTLGSSSFSTLTIGPHSVSLELTHVGLTRFEKHHDKLGATAAVSYTSASKTKTASATVSLQAAKRKRPAPK